MTRIRQIKTDNRNQFKSAKTRKICDLLNYVKLILKIDRIELSVKPLSY